VVVVFSEENLTMLAPLPSIEAFRRDAVSRDAVELDDGVVASWLESATRLERAAMTRGAERERLLRGLLSMHGVVTFPESGISTAALIESVLDLAKAMADGACFRLAHNILSTLLAIVPESDHLERGRIIAQLAKAARHLGETVAASRYYKEVERIGEEQQINELLGRSWIGFGILAQFRGDFPESRRRFSDVLALDGAATESIRIAHTQLAMAAATAADHDTAASHAWQAFQSSSSPSEQAESLVNLAQLLLEAGHARAALSGFSAALARKPIYRVELPILGGAACAAAAAGLPAPRARALVKLFSDRLERVMSALRDGETLPWPSTSALVEVSEALAVVGDEERSNEFADKASALANAHGFHQLSYRLENPVHVAPPRALAASTNEIIAAVDELEGAELVGAAS
jgi:tetratricopeptide (TPR) repeat protein